MIPLIQKEATEKRGWIEEDDILEIVSISESTPGPMAVNAATFIGYKVAGFSGALAATIGVVLPSFVIISLISTLLKYNYDLRIVRYAFFGIRAGVIAVLADALVKMYKKSPKGLFSYIVMAGAFVTVAILGLNVFMAVIISALMGLVYSLMAERRHRNDIS